MWILSQLTQHNPSSLALIADGRTLSYGELDAWSSQLCSDLRARGVREGVTVGILAPASFEYFAALIAIWKAGGIAVPLQPAHPVEELRFIASDAGLKTILVEKSCEALAGKISEAETEAVQIKRSENRVDDRTDNCTEAATATATATASVLMIYTSGTTGKPKGVLTTSDALTAQMKALHAAWEWSPSDRTLNVLPLHHVHGVVVVACCALAAGAQMELSAKFDAALVWERIASGAINVFMAVPTVYNKLVEHWNSQIEGERSRLGAGAARMRLMVSGSAALPVPLFESWKKIAGTPLLERYGMTEMGIALTNPYRGERVAGHVGFPVHGVEVRLSEEGELQTRGPIVFREYWKRAEATAESFTADGWFKTGDIAEFDAEGGYKILGRSSQDIIKTGGYKVSALEIENALLEYPDVREAAVIGVPDDTWGERVAAVLVCQNHPEVKQLEDFLRSKLARYKIPTLWSFEDSLPRNAMGKVQKKKIAGDSFRAH